MPFSKILHVFQTISLVALFILLDTIQLQFLTKIPQDARTYSGEVLHAYRPSQERHGNTYCVGSATIGGMAGRCV